ncbi:MAG: DUF87 domain-containing protein [Alphaproteobacteria bacterium]|nr:DUF87 domain-containing protein [Alphaproteobacteria bacterium]
MAGQSKFLPDSVSSALRRIAVRVSGGAIFIVSIWAIVALVFHNAYLDGFAASGNFGHQTIMGNIVGVLRYAFGFLPALFVLMCCARTGIKILFTWTDDTAPEYNLLRAFVAVCVGAAGFGMIAPRASFGGMIGAVAATDASAIMGGMAIIPGILCIVVFCVLGGMLLHVRYAHVRMCVRASWRTMRWVLSLFHLVPPTASDEEDTSDTDDELDDTAEDTDTDNDSEPGDTDDTPRTRHTTRRNAAPAAASAPRRAHSGEYRMPDVKFLEKSNFGKSIVTPELKQNAKAMEVHFAEYGVNGRVVGIRPGPIVTLYEFMPDSGTRMVDVNKTVKDMTRAMATENIRIAHIPRTELIGVEMVNLNRQTVRFQGLVANETFVNSKYKIPLALGVDIGGNPMYFDLAKMPHMLIAGRTGSGKSVFVQSIITSIVYHFTPDKCKLIIIDPKGVDFGFWDDIPHLITPIVKLDPAAAVNALKWAVREMEERYKQLQLVNARNIESYNEIVAEKRNNGEKITRQVAVGTDEETGELLFETQDVDMSDMPYIAIIIDEVADLMSLARKEVEACVQRIAQKARAAGIHLVMATQRPDATTITGVIKANFPTRVSFQARSNIDSMTTLGEKGAENLLACGDMLFSEAGKIPVRIHGAFIADDELSRIGNFLRAQGTPEYATGVTDGDVASDMVGGGAQPAVASTKDSKDADLYTQAKECVLRDKKPTISYIQRRLGIGYNKAAGFMERMESEGIVSAPDANNKRHIL